MLVPAAVTRARIEVSVTYPAEGVTFEPAAAEVAVTPTARPE